MAYASGLPTIKCSDCGCDIDIAQIADHVCNAAPSVAPEPLKPMDRITNAFSSLRTGDKLSGPFKSKPAPAGINTSIANRPFLHPGPRTPGSNSPFRMPMRSATSPASRPRSPEISLSQECAFPSFPSSPAPPQRARTDGHTSQRNESRSESRNNSRSESRSGIRNWSRRTPSKQISSRPSSPPDSTGNGYQQQSTRKSSFSGSKSNPDLTLEDSVPPVPPFHESHGHTPAGSVNGIRLPFGSPQREEQDPHDRSSSNTDQFEDHRPTPAISVAGPHKNRRQPSQGSIHFRKPSVSAATRPLYEIGSTKTHRSTASRGGSPSKLDVEFGVPRSGSAQSERSDRRLFDAPPVPVSNNQSENDSEWKSQRSLSNSTDEPQAPPPLFAQNKALDFGKSNPYHSPSESTSSHGSTRQTSSSRSSPQTSTSSFAPTRKQSDAGESRLLDSFTESPAAPAPLYISVPPVPPPSSSPVSAPVLNGSSQISPPPRTPAPVSAPPTDNPQPFQQPRTRKAARSFSRPNAYKPNSPQPTPQPTPPPPQVVQPPESPMDPAMQGGRLPILNFPDESSDRFPPPEQSPQAPRSAPLFRQPPLSDLPPPPGFIPTSRSPHGPPPARRATTGHKGNCRGCGDLIKGKSVSSADGRLTGRWHKQCFVCRSCSEPFQTTDFYVLGNHPYCARHYHELNQSMCTKCDRGIEGPYLESDRMLKYHPHCFTCADCHLILRDNYFEDPNGKILCEQHAFGTNHLGPGRRFPEKRSTRLMMI